MLKVNNSRVNKLEATEKKVVPLLGEKMPELEVQTTYGKKSGKL